MCGFINENETDSYDWTRHHGPTSSRDTGPSIDHTCGNRKGKNISLELKFNFTSYGAQRA